MSKQPHLSELFKPGELITIEVPNYEKPLEPHKLELWLQHPSVLQREEAMTKARARQARKQKLLLDEDSDEYMALWQVVAEMKELDDLVQETLRWERARLRQQAYQEVLYSEEVGSDWGSEGQAYIDVLNAIEGRIQELVELNEGLSEEDSHMIIKPEEDKELTLLQAEQEKFEGEVLERAERLEAIEKAQLEQRSLESLRKGVFEKMVDAESSLAWMSEYRTRMLFYAVRYPDDHKRFYFKDADALWDLPEQIRARLMQEWDHFDGQVDDLKNLLSPLPSSV